MRAPRDHATARSGERGAVLVIFAIFMSSPCFCRRSSSTSATGSSTSAIFSCRLTLPRSPLRPTSTTPARLPSKSDLPSGRTVRRRRVGRHARRQSHETQPKSPALYNEQIGGTSQANIHEEINSKKYFGQSTGDTTTVEKAPCEPEASMIDVKMTETEPPVVLQICQRSLHQRACARLDRPAAVRDRGRAADRVRTGRSPRPLRQRRTRWLG